ncbi:MAG: hypothetical protein HEP71_28540 [Roseivirga sp.]|nr:hypothetical protein [Roseivirga sp.]
MKKLIKKLLIFILPVLVVLYPLDLVITKGLKKTRYEEFAEWNAILNGEVEADMVIMGGSRAFVHFSPEILDSSLQLNAYNLGMDGYLFPMQQARFDAYLEQNDKPRYVLQSVSMSTLSRRNGLYSREQFLPYLDNEKVLMATKAYEGLSWFDYNVPLLRYRKQWDLITIGATESLGVRHISGNEKHKGYVGRSRSWDGTFEKFVENSPEGIVADVEEEVVMAFESYLKRCKENDIQVILVYTPEFEGIQRYFVNRAEVMGIYQRLATKFDLEFLDYSADPMCSDQTFFYNSQHMNKSGAEKFSRKLAGDLKEIVAN